jgi:hypothetical protein
MADQMLIALLSSMLASLPGVTEKPFPTHISFFTGKNVFVFTSRTSNRVVLKLPKDRIATLLQQKDYEPLTMGKRTMKEWIVIEHAKPADYKKDLQLLKEAKAFVEAGKKK